MLPQVYEFIYRHRLCSLTTMLRGGSPHAAALHYSSQPEPFHIFFSTDRTSKKCQQLLGGSPGLASIVIGFSEEEWLTLQLDGTIQTIIAPSELTTVHKIHYAKHPNAAQYRDDPDTLFLKFTPTWWRYSDYNTDPATTLSSEQ